MNEIKKQIRQKQNKLNALKKKCAEIRAEIDALNKQISQNRRKTRKEDGIAALEAIFKSGEPLRHSAQSYGWSYGCLCSLLKDACRKKFPKVCLIEDFMFKDLGRTDDFLRYLFDKPFSERIDNYWKENYPIKDSAKWEESRLAKLIGENLHD